MDGDGTKGGGGAEMPSADQNASPNSTPAAAGGGDGVSAAATAAAAASRRPFTSLTQEEADLALARVLQEQERAYMMLTAQGGAGGDYVGYYDDGYDYEDDEEAESLQSDEEGLGSDYGDDEEEGEVAPDEDEEVGDAEGADVDPTQYEDDEAYARALQDAEEREVAGRLMALAGFSDLGQDMEQDVDEEEDEEEDGEGGSQDEWDNVDPEEYSYEELIALGEVVGTESRGLSADTLASLPSVTYKAQDKQDSNMDQCVICRVEFEDGESLVGLPCKHSYHSECINQWLQLNKVCPMCSAEVPTSANNPA